MPETPLGITYPTPGDPNDVPADLQRLALDVDGLLSLSRVWRAERANDDSLGPNVWGSVTSLTIPAAPAGLYRIEAINVVSSGQVWQTSHRLMVNGTPVGSDIRDLIAVGANYAATPLMDVFRLTAPGALAVFVQVQSGVPITANLGSRLLIEFVTPITT